MATQGVSAISVLLNKPPRQWVFGPRVSPICAYSCQGGWSVSAFANCSQHVIALGLRQCRVRAPLLFLLTFLMHEFSVRTFFTRPVHSTASPRRHLVGTGFTAQPANIVCFRHAFTGASASLVMSARIRTSRPMSDIPSSSVMFLKLSWFRTVTFVLSSGSLS